MKNYRVFAVNPGSTSTKIALFEGEQKRFSATVDHAAAELAGFSEISEQLPYRLETIRREIEKAGISLEGVDAFSGRGGGLVSLEGGTYRVNDILHEHARTCFTVKHPATLGPQLARKLAEEYGGEAFVVNPPDVDEFCELARITGIKGMYRESRVHALNQKEIAIRYAASQNKSYEELRLVVCHIGGGVSVTAHCQGKMIDSNDIVNGDGPMAPTRCGSVPVRDIVKLCFSGQYTEKELLAKTTRNGGWLDLLGTADGREVEDRSANGDEEAKLVYDAMIYQIAKCAGSCAAVLKGRVDAVILTGGLVKSAYLVEELSGYLSAFAPIVAMPGEFEMEALAAGATRVLRGEEEARDYTGIPAWQPAGQKR